MTHPPYLKKDKEDKNEEERGRKGRKTKERQRNGGRERMQHALVS